MIAPGPVCDQDARSAQIVDHDVGWRSEIAGRLQLRLTCADAVENERSDRQIDADIQVLRDARRRRKRQRVERQIGDIVGLFVAVDATDAGRIGNVVQVDRSDAADPVPGVQPIIVVEVGSGAFETS